MSSEVLGEVPAFVHLHVHTQYSLLQGAIWADGLGEKAAALGMKAVAITDTHNLFGAVDFYNSAKKAGVKPIIGCEVIYCPSGTAAPKPGTQASGPRFHHLVLLCKNLEGYQNLCELVTRSFTETPPPQKGAPAGPRAYVTREQLDKWGTGLVVLSGCLRGEIPYKILAQEEDAALESALWFQKRFGEDFYFELQDSALPEQAVINEKLHAWGEKHGIPCVATNDCHYLEPCEHEAHEVLMCIEGGRNLDFERPKSLVPPEFHFRRPAEMAERFARYPEAIANSVRIADKCDVKFRFKDEQGRAIYHLPKFRPEGVTPGSAEDANFDPIQYFRDEARKGLELRFTQPGFAAIGGNAEREAPYRARLEEELAMIERTGFAGYFLIVADFIQWAKRKGIPVGPGRGSGAGSLVAYSLQITDIDPIAFNLLFERFINPERISMPDFDVDFCQDRRGEVIEYVQRKYGRENVCQIITFGKLQARAVIKDVGRVLGLSFAESDSITKLLPDELDMTIDRALRLEPRLKEKMEAEPRVAKVVEYARSLEGLYRNAGIHAAGVIITEKPVVSYCPLYVAKDGDIVTQFDKDFAEAIGLVKFDFLGLKTLTVIDNAVKLVRAVAEPGTTDADFRLERMNYSDPLVFALISSGDTDGIFQVESSGMKDLCTGMQPTSLEDITAINALYRPGPLGSGMVENFIDRKHGRKPIEYDDEKLAPILKDTYGVILYQEQVMQIARELAGYSLGQADLLRRAMGKKKVEEMAEHREIFVKGATAKGLPAAKAEAIFDLMAKFAEYGFNKSHSAAYGVLTYQTAYLKTHYPAEFMAALMTTEMDNTDKITKYIADARSHGLPRAHAGRQPLAEALQRGAGRKRREGDPLRPRGASRAWAESRWTVSSKPRAGSAPFKSMLDFCRRVPTRKVNKKVLESLTMAGALDSISEGRTAPRSSRRSRRSSSTRATSRPSASSGRARSLTRFGRRDQAVAPPTTLFQAGSRLAAGAQAHA